MSCLKTKRSREVAYRPVDGSPATTVAERRTNSPILKETSKIERSESIDLNLGQVWDRYPPKNIYRIIILYSDIIGHRKNYKAY